MKKERSRLGIEKALCFQRNVFAIEDEFSYDKIQSVEKRKKNNLINLNENLSKTKLNTNETKPKLGKMRIATTKNANVNNKMFSSLSV